MRTSTLLWHTLIMERMRKLLTERVFSTWKISKPVLEARITRKVLCATNFIKVKNISTLKQPFLTADKKAIPTAANKTTKASHNFKFSDKSLLQNLLKLQNSKISSPAQDNRFVVLTLSQVSRQRKATQALRNKKNSSMRSMSHSSWSVLRKRKWCSSHGTRITSIWSREKITEEAATSNNS